MDRRDFNRILFLMAGFIIAVGSKGLAQGKIEVVGGTTYDWGKVNPAKLHTVLKVRNVGNGDLHIKEVRPTCSCTIDTLVTNVLKPGEVTDLKLSVDMNGRSGQVEKVVTIFSDDSTNPALPITLKAYVKRPMMFAPGQYFYVHDVKVGQEVASSITIRNTGEEPFTLFPPEFDSTSAKSKVRFDMTAKREVKPGDSVVVKAYITPMATGTINDSAKMRSTQKEFATIPLSIYGYVPESKK
jgi:hypothetical protein